jgi:hypothetical protein
MVMMKKTVHLQTQNKASEIPRVKRVKRARIALFLTRRPKVRTSQGSEEDGASWFL